MTQRSVVHVYFGDATAHTIAMNYVRCKGTRLHKILLRNPFNNKSLRLAQLFFKLFGLRLTDSSSIVHTHDVVSATLAVCLLFENVIFDSHEIYESLAGTSIIGNIIARMERFATRNSSLVIYPSRQRLEYCVKGADINCIVIQNLFLPTNVALSKEHEEALQQLRELVESAPGRRFIYAGTFTPVRGIAEIIDAFKDDRLAGDTLFLAGKKSDLLEELLEDAPSSIHHLGALPHPVMTGLLRYFDAGIAVYKPVNANNRLAAPTKLFEFLYFGLTVIANRSVYVEDVVGKLKLENVYLAGSVTCEEILRACLSVERQKKPISDSVLQGVSWLSQLQRIESMYSSVEEKRPIRDLGRTS